MLKFWSLLAIINLLFSVNLISAAPPKVHLDIQKSPTWKSIVTALLNGRSNEQIKNNLTVENFKKHSSEGLFYQAYISTENTDIACRVDLGVWSYYYRIQDILEAIKGNIVDYNILHYVLYTFSKLNGWIYYYSFDDVDPKKQLEYFWKFMLKSINQNPANRNRMFISLLAIDNFHVALFVIDHDEAATISVFYTTKTSQMNNDILPVWEGVVDYINKKYNVWNNNISQNKVSYHSYGSLSELVPGFLHTNTVIGAVEPTEGLCTDIIINMKQDMIDSKDCVIVFPESFKKRKTEAGSSGETSSKAALSYPRATTNKIIGTSGRSQSLPPNLPSGRKFILQTQKKRQQKSSSIYSI